MKTTIANTSRLSNTTFHRRCSGRQGYWWLRSEAGEFVAIGDHRGDDDIRLTLDLTPGKWTLGCGPAGEHGVREHIVVADTADAEHLDADALATLRASAPADVLAALDEMQWDDVDSTEHARCAIAAWCDRLVGRDRPPQTRASRAPLIAAARSIHDRLVARRVEMTGG